MIDFENASFKKLTEWDADKAREDLQDLLVADEVVQLAFKGVRDSVTFTNRRIIAINTQGMTGKKKDMTSLPYGKVQAFSIETAGTFDLESELELWFSSLGRVRLEFGRGVDIRGVSRILGEHVL
ncbi:PH domain-containing protein [Cellulomonas soli]|uniref:PH domain-containing protein n=1 Tax=Cellulomonas soli TaxID=931535 RepID=UPI003F85C0C2